MYFTHDLEVKNNVLHFYWAALAQMLQTIWLEVI